MKTECEKCGARYRIPEEKLEGKLLKIKCKKCEHIFTVRDMLAAPSRDALSSVSRKTGVISTLNNSEIPREWYYAVNGQSFGPYSDLELVERFENAQLGSDAHVWKQGLATWLPAMQVPDFAAAIESAQTNLPGFSLPFAPKANTRRTNESSGRYTVEVRHPGAAMDSTRLAAEDELDIDFAFASAFGDHGRGVSQTAPHRRNPIIERTESPVVDTLAEQIRQATAGKRESALTSKESAIASLSAAARESRSSSRRETASGDDSDEPYPSSSGTNPRAHVANRRETIISSERKAIELPPAKAMVREAETSVSAQTSGSAPDATKPRASAPARSTRDLPVVSPRSTATGGSSAVGASSPAQRSGASAPMTLSERLEQLKSQSAAASPKRTTSLPPVTRSINAPPKRPASLPTGANVQRPERSSTPPARPSGPQRTLVASSPQIEITNPITDSPVANTAAPSPALDPIQEIAPKSSPVMATPMEPETTSHEAESAQAKEIPVSKLPSGVELSEHERYLLNDDEETFTGQASDPKELFQQAIQVEQEESRRLVTQELNVDDFIEEISDILVMGESTSGRRFMTGVTTQALDSAGENARSTQPNPILEEKVAQQARGLKAEQLDDTLDIPPRSHTARVIAMARRSIRSKAPFVDRRRRKELLIIATAIAVLAFTAIFMLVQMNAKRAAEAHAREQAEIARLAEIEALKEAERIRLENVATARNRAASSVALAIGRAERIARVAGQEREQRPSARNSRPQRSAASTSSNQAVPASHTTSAPIPVSSASTSTQSSSSRNPSKSYFAETLQSSVRSSVGRCAQRARAISGSLSFSRVELSVTIRPDGTVERINAQRALRDSPFMNCMSTESSRWRFASFQGSRTTIQHSFVVQ